MLEVMDMSADIHVYVVPAEYRVEPRLHIPAFASVFRCFGINGVVSGHDYPVFFSGGQDRIDPCELLFVILLASIGLVSAGIFYKKIDDFIVDQVSTNYEYQGNVYTRFTQPKNAGNANLLGVELSYQRDFGFIAPALKCIGFYGTYTYTHSRVEDFNFEGRENEEGLSMPGSPAHTANASLYFEKAGLNIRVSYNFASDFIDEMGESTFYDRYYDKVNYMDANASYTFGKKIKTTFYAEANNLLNQPLRYYQGTKDRTMQAEYYGVKVNAGVKINF